MLLDVTPDTLRASPYQPRKHFDDAKLAELAASISAHGVLQPIVVRERADRGKYFEIVAGERRWRAAKIAEVETVPILVRQLTDAEAAELAVLENAQRDDLTPLEEADGFRLLVEQHGFTMEAIAERVGKSRAFVGNRITIARAGPAVRAALESGSIPATAALILGRMPEALQAEATAQVAEFHGNKSQRAADVAQAIGRNLSDAPFDTTEAPACAICPKRTAAERGLFAADFGTDDICLDGACWRGKCDAAFARRAAAHPGPVLDPKRAAEILSDDEALDYDGPYADLKSHLGDDTDTDEAILKGCPVTLAQDPNTGRAVELIDRDKLRNVLAKLDAKREKAVPAANPKLAAAEREQRERAQRRDAAVAKLREDAIAEGLKDGAHARKLLIELSGGLDDTAVLRLAGVKKSSQLPAWAAKATGQEVVEALLVVEINRQNAWDDGGLVRMAKALGLPVPSLDAPKADAPKPKTKRKGGA